MSYWVFLVYTAPVAFSMGASPDNLKYLEVLVPDARRSDISFAYERLVPAAVYFYGWSFHSQSAFIVKEAHH